MNGSFFCLTCPICSSKLILAEQFTLKCENNHSFDRAKEGYYHLLPVNKKKSLVPGDSSDMMKARRSFLENEYYNPLVDFLHDLLKIKGKRVGLNLDIGCGEGFYTHHLFEHTEQETLGFDISKHGVRMAAKKYKDIQFFVGGIYDIPIDSKSVMNAVSIFTPICSKEFSRVLRPDGQLFLVYAGGNHLKELALEIYEDFKPHSYHPKHKLQNDFFERDMQEITFSVDLDNKEDVLNLLKMTPYYWKTNEEIRNNIINKLPLMITCHFKVSTFELI